MSRRRFSSYLVIENWNVDDVQQFLEKNGFGECCESFKKRNIDGHGFLTLTEGQLMLWKRELSLVNIRKISKFIQELAQEPEKFVFPDSEKNATTEQPVKTNQFSTFRPQSANQNSLQKSRGVMVSSKNTVGSVASIVSNMGCVEKQNAANNLSCNTSVVAKNGSLHVKNPLFQQTRNSESSSSCSDNCSWDTNFSDDEAPLYLSIIDTEEQNNGDNQSASNKSILERADSILAQLDSHEHRKSPLLHHPEVSPSRGTNEISDTTVSRPDREELQKPQVPRHSELSPSRNAMPGEPPPVQMPSKLPAPPIDLLQNPLHLKKIASSLNMPAAVERARSEQWDEEEQYESIDNENLPSKEAIAAFTQEFNFQKSLSQMSLNSFRDVNEELSPIPIPISIPWSQKNLQNGWSKPVEKQFSVTKANSVIEAPSLPERSSKTTALHPTCVVPPSNRLPPSIPITSRPLPPQPSDSPTSRSSLSAYREAGSMSNQEEDEEYECVKPPDASQNADDENLSDEYESIRDHTKMLSADSQGGCTDYYLQPVAMQGSSERERPVLPPKPNSSLEIPSLEPPSLPARQSEDLGNSPSSPGNSGDGVTGLFGELLRKVRNKPTYLSSSTLEREKTPTPDVKKQQPLPSRDHKPPPPVDRPSVHQNNQRPLPPTPESRKSPLSTKDQSNLGSRRGSRVTPISQMPWYHNVDRKRADELLRNSQDGAFLLRPSSQTQNPLSLTLWYNKRIYNISVRHRPDGKYALGYEKPNEQSFASIEELVNNYQSENLVLYSNGERTGRTLLTSWPPRRD